MLLAFCFAFVTLQLGNENYILFVWHAENQNANQFNLALEIFEELLGKVGTHVIIQLTHDMRATCIMIQVCLFIENVHKLHITEHVL